MPRVITKTWGIFIIRKTLSSSKCLVVMLSRTAKDTETITRITNNAAPDSPWCVMVNVIPAIFQATNGSPGVKILNNAGIAIKNENNGMNTHVRFRKNLKFIPETSANNKHSAYRHNKIKMLLASNIWIMNKRKVIVFTLGSNDCKKPFCAAYSSAKMDSFKKDIAPSTERSMKFPLFLLKNSPIS